MKYIKVFCIFIIEIYKSKALLIKLIKDDFKSRYFTNYLGILWAFIQPTVTVLVFWFIFQVGFKSTPVKNVPFVLWLIAGMIPWFFIAETFGSGTNAILGYSFLVKKIVFRVSLLPIVKIFSALIVHLFFIMFMFGMYLVYGFKPSLYWLEIIYYLFCTILVMLGISWFTSSVVVFFRDTVQIIAVVLQVGFWMTPIFWSLSMVPERFHWLFNINPAYYITQGYRDALIDHVWFWDRPLQTMVFWLITIIFLIGGATVFKKLRPHFADVL